MLIENLRCYRLTSCGVNRDCDKKGQRSDRCLIKAESFGMQRTKLELTWISYKWEDNVVLPDTVTRSRGSKKSSLPIVKDLCVTDRIKHSAGMLGA